MLLRDRAVYELVRKAEVLLRGATERDWLGAEALLDLAAELKPADARVEDGFGCLALRRMELPEARFRFVRAVTIDPGYARGFVHLARLHDRQGDRQTGEAFLEKALQLNPLDSEARELRAAWVPAAPDEKRRAEKERWKARLTARAAP